MGTSDNTHGERKDANPAIKATPKLTCDESIRISVSCWHTISSFDSIAPKSDPYKGYPAWETIALTGRLSSTFLTVFVQTVPADLHQVI